MSQFKRAVKRFFRISQKPSASLLELPQGPEVLDATQSHSPVPQSSDARSPTVTQTLLELPQSTSALDATRPLSPASQISDAGSSTVTQNSSELLCTRNGGEGIPAAQSSTDTVVGAVDDHAQEAKPVNQREEGAVAAVGEGEDWDEGDDEEQQDTPPDLVDKTHLEMLISDLYVALSDNDNDIAALRTHDGEKFTHIIRLNVARPAKNPSSKPSGWSIQQTRLADNGPRELLITVPNVAVRFCNANDTILTPMRLLTIRNYIAVALRYRNPKWDTSKLDLPSPFKWGRVLVVGPPDRQADVLAISLCYLAFYTGKKGRDLFKRMQVKSLVRSPWREQSLGEPTHVLIEAIAEIQRL